MTKGSLISVVMVDDDSEDVFSVRKALGNAELDIEFDAIDSGAKFLEQLNQSESPDPDLVLLDINMPRMNGYEVLSALKDTKKWQDITVIMLSTSNSEADRRKALELGATEFVTKPHSQADMTVLMQKLEQCFPNSG